jgi:hypothetical protein
MVAGTLILDQIDRMSEMYGREIVKQAIASLPGVLREELDLLVRGGWCSVDAARELKIAIAALAGETVPTLQRRVTRAGLERTFNSVWRFFLSWLSDERIARHTPLIYSRVFDRGTLELVALRERGAEFELRGWPAIDEFDLQGLVVGVETALQLAGRGRAVVASERSGRTTRIIASWG